MILAALLVARHCVKAHGMNTFKNIMLYIGIDFSEFLYEHFYFLTFAVAYSVAAVCIVFGKAAGTLDKV